MNTNNPKDPTMATTAVPNGSSRFHIGIISLVIIVITISIYSLVGRDLYTGSQIGLFHFLNQSLHFLPSMWLAITDLGDGAILFPLLSVVLLLSAKTWLSLWVATPIAAIFSNVGKSYFHYPRPAQIIPQDQMNIIGEVLTANNSTPSGHSITFFTVGTIVTYMFLSNKNIKFRKPWILFVVAFTIAGALSRVVVGAHWPLDTLLGAMLGTFAGGVGIYIVNKWSDNWSWMASNKFTIANVLILSAFGAFILLSKDYFHNPLALFAAAVAVFTSICLIRKVVK